MEISKKTVEELKSLAYDELVKLQVTQRNIELLQNAIKRKQAVEQSKEVKDGKNPKA